MKITIIGPAYPYRGGIALFSNRLAEEFKKEGHDVSVITFKLQYPSFLFPGKTQFSEAEAPNLQIERLINSVNPFNWSGVGKQVAKQQPDLVIFKYWMPFMAPCFGTIAKHIKKNCNAKLIGLVHNLIPHEKHSYDKSFSKYFVKQMDGFLALSDSVLNDIKELSKDKPTAISPHPLYDNFGTAINREQAIQNLGLDATNNYMLFFGLVRQYKGLDLALKALADERLKGKTKLIVAGEFYDDEAPYRAIIKQNGLEDDVILHNRFIPDAEVANYFCAADIIVQPYKHATQSGVTQIAYHFEKPMLVTDVGGLKEIVPSSVGYVVEPNEKAIADALVDFYENKKAVIFMQGAKAEKKKYSWSKMVENIHKLYKSLLKSN